MNTLDFNFYLKLRVLLGVEGIGPGKVLNLLAKFKNFDKIFSAPINLLINTPGISNNLAKRIKYSKQTLNKYQDTVSKEIETLKKLGANLITYWDDNYPKLLRKIYYPPLVIYVLGKLKDEDNYSLSIVGTRRPTAYGKIQAAKFAKSLVEQNITIISGMARGIDSESHRSAIKNGGRTIAVVGSGLDVIYPAENKRLFYDISDNGAVISEFPIGTLPEAANFPKRNRIISGLSLGTIVIETKLNGGAMQTASHALDQNREVFAVPGNLGINQSEGTNSLIQKGEAKLVKCADDVIIELESKLKPVIKNETVRPHVDINMFEQNILDILSSDPVHIDKISELASMTTSDCLVHLLSLEFKGLVRQLPGKMFSAC